MAARTASSRCRPIARASSRFATFTQATSSTMPTRRDQDDQRVPDIADDVLVQGDHGEGEAAVGGVELREPVAQPAGERVHLGLRRWTLAPGFNVAIRL